MNNDDVLYCTGINQDGKRLIGGVWRMWHQNGFQMEMSHMLAKEQGQAVDWAEAAADASLTNDAPAFFKIIGTFLTEEDMRRIKMGFVLMGEDYEGVLSSKRANGTRFLEEIARETASSVDGL